MKKRRRIGVLMLLLLLLVSFSAAAEEAPEYVFAMVPGGQLEKIETMGEMRMYVLRIPESGEELVLVCSGDEMLMVETRQPAQCDPAAGIMERSRAEELVRAAYPDCRILFAEDDPSGKRLVVAGENFCGSIIVADDCIHSRSLEMGLIFRGGLLTMDGALRLMELHRPEASFHALEMDREDGYTVYEGEAMLGGDEYEFEIDAASGKLLEWERD